MADPTTAGGGTEGLRAPPVSSIVDEAEQLAVSLTEAVLAAGLGFKGPFEDFAPLAEPLLQDAIGAARRDGAQIANEVAAAALARASAEQAMVEAERDEREAWAAAWHRVAETTLILMDLSPALGGDEAASAIQAALAKLAADRDRLKAALAFYADPDDWSGAPWRLTFQSPSRDGNGWDVARAALKLPKASDAP